MKVRKSFTMPSEVATIIEAAAETRFNGNQSTALVNMVTFWKERERARKRKEFLRVDSLVAQAIAQAQTQPKISKLQARKNLLSLTDEVATAVRENDELETEEEIVESIKSIRKERRDAFSSGS